jgi:hypothetical protein
MKSPRFRIRTLLIVVAVVAILLGWLARPYPTGLRLSTELLQIVWSNGSLTNLEHDGNLRKLWQDGKLPDSWRYRAFLVVVDWTDGTTSYHLQVPQKGRWYWWHSIDIRRYRR